MPELKVNRNHEILRIGLHATEKEIIDAHKKAKVYWHPDKWFNTDPKKIEEVTQNFVNLDKIRDELLRARKQNPEYALPSRALAHTPSAGVSKWMKAAFSHLGPIVFDIAFNLFFNFLMEELFSQSQQQDLLSVVQKMLDKKIEELKIFNCEQAYNKESSALDVHLKAIYEISISRISPADNERLKSRLADVLTDLIKGSWSYFISTPLNESTEDDLNQEVELLRTNIISLINKVLTSLPTDKISVINLSSMLIKELYPLVHQLLNDNLHGVPHLLSYNEEPREKEIVAPHAAELVIRLSEIILLFKYQLLSKDIINADIEKLEKRIGEYNRVVFGTVQVNEEVFSHLNLSNLVAVSSSSFLPVLNSDIFDDASTSHSSITTYIDRLESLKMVFHCKLHRSYTVLEALYRINFEFGNAEAILALRSNLQHELDRIFRSLHPMFYDLAYSYRGDTGTQLPSTIYTIRNIRYSSCFLHSDSTGREVHCTEKRQEKTSAQWTIIRESEISPFFVLRNKQKNIWLSTNYSQKYYIKNMTIFGGYSEPASTYGIDEIQTGATLGAANDKALWQIKLPRKKQSNCIYLEPANALVCGVGSDGRGENVRRETKLPFFRNSEITSKHKEPNVMLYIGSFFNQAWIGRRGVQDIDQATWELQDVASIKPH